MSVRRFEPALILVRSTPTRSGMFALDGRCQVRDRGELDNAMLSGQFDSTKSRTSRKNGQARGRKQNSSVEQRARRRAARSYFRRRHCSPASIEPTNAQQLAVPHDRMRKNIERITGESCIDLYSASTELSLRFLGVKTEQNRPLGDINSCPTNVRPAREDRGEQYPREGGGIFVSCVRIG